MPDLTSEVTATDPCGASLTVTQAPAPGSSIGIGQTVVTFTVANRFGATAQCQATVTVTDSAPTLSINDVSLLEGNVGTTDAVFTVSLSQPACTPVSVQFTTADGTAVHAGTESVLDPNLVVSGNQVTVSWSTGLQGYTLQSKAKVAGAQWVDVPQPPVVQNGQYVVSQTVGGSHGFLSLAQDERGQRSSRSSPRATMPPGSARSLLPPVKRRRRSQSV